MSPRNPPTAKPFAPGKTSMRPKGRSTATEMPPSDCKTAPTTERPRDSNAAPQPARLRSRLAQPPLPKPFSDEPAVTADVPLLNLMPMEPLFFKSD